MQRSLWTSTTNVMSTQKSAGRSVLWEADLGSSWSMVTASEVITVYHLLWHLEAGHMKLPEVASP